MRRVFYRLATGVVRLVQAMAHSTETPTRAEEGGDIAVQVHSSPEGVLDAWGGLADRLGVAPFLRPGWLLPWSRAFSSGRLSVFTAVRGQELVGVLPFFERRGVLSTPTNWHTPIFGYLAADRAASVALAERFVGAARVRADLSFLDRTDPGLKACVGAAERATRPMIVRTILRSPYVQLEGTDWESYRAGLERKPRKDLERRKRRLGEHGRLTLDMADGRTDFDGLLSEGLRLEGSGWKKDRGTAIASNPTTRAFYEEVARWASERGWLILAFLRLSGRAIAFDLGLRANGRVYVLKGGFDPEFRRFGPGQLLAYESLRWGFEEGVGSYELLGAADPHKLVWTRSVRELVRFQAFGASFRGRLNHLAWSRGRPAALQARRLMAGLGAGPS
jgi:CelD/BcsL family acetyltransferase involved in cellulose biosynthesis